MRSQSGMLLCSGQCTWQNGIPHCSQRDACSAARARLETIIDLAEVVDALGDGTLVRHAPAAQQTNCIILPAAIALSFEPRSSALRQSRRCFNL